MAGGMLNAINVRVKILLIMAPKMSILIMEKINDSEVNSHEMGNLLSL